MNRVEEKIFERELAETQLLKREAFNLTGSSPKLDILIRQLTLKGLCRSLVIYKERSQYFLPDLSLLFALQGNEQKKDKMKRGL